MAGEMKIGAAVTLDGEKEFKQAVAGINKEMTVLGSEMKKVTAQYADNATSMEALKAKQDVLSRTTDEHKARVELLKNALASAKKEFGENSDKAQEWQIKLNNAEAALAKTESQLKQTTSDIEKFGKESNQSGDQIDKAGKQAEQSGKDAKQGEDGWNKLGNGLKSIGGAAAIATAAIAAAAIAGGVALVKGLIGAASSAAQYADDINTLAAQTGLATDTLQGMSYAANILDVDVESQAKGLSKVVKAMGEAAGAGKDYVTVADGLTVSIRDSNGNLKSSEEVYFSTIDALGSMTDATAREIAAQQIFGKSYQDMMPLIKAGSEGLKELTAEAERNGYILSGDALNSLNAYQDSLDKLANQKVAFTNALGAAMAPALQTFTDSATEATAALTQLVNGSINADEFSAKISGIVTGLTEEINKSLPAILDLAVGIITAVGDGLVQALPILATSATQIITHLATSIVAALPTLVTVALTIVEQLGQAIITNLPQLTQAAIDLIMGLGTMIIENLPMLLDAALQIIVQLATGLADSLPTLIPTIVDTVITIVETLIDNIDMLIDASIAIIVALAEGLIQALPKLIEKAPEIIIKLVTAIIENVPKLLEATVAIIGMLISGLASGFVEILGKVGGWVNENIVQPIKDKVSDFTTAGGNLIKGVWQGISDQAAWLWGKVSGFFTSLTDRIKDFFGIASPSKLFRDTIGVNLAKGIGVGFENQMANVAKQMTASVPTSFDTQINATARMGESIVNGMASVMGGATGGTYTINLVTDGKTLASVIFDPLRGIATQRGVALT